MGTLLITEIYEHLDAAIGKETARKLTTFIGCEINDKFEQSMKTLATKEDLAKLALSTKEDLANLALSTKEEIARLALSTKEDLANLALSTKENLSKLEVKLENKINDFKIDIVRWMFAFWITVTMMFIGLYFKS